MEPERPDLLNKTQYIFIANGGWGPYGPYSSCSKTCDGGIKTKTRTCNKPKPFGGGKPCSGSNKSNAVCNMFSCPASPKGIKKFANSLLMVCNRYIVNCKK